MLMASSLSVAVACDSEDPITRADADATTETSPDVAETTVATETTVVSETFQPDIAPPTCAPLSVSGLLVASDVPGAFTLGGGIDLGFGDARPDALVLEFYSNATGTFDLGTGDNRNYGTCDQCVRIVQDIDAQGAQPKHFFQKAGRILVDPTTPPEEGYLKVEIQDLELIEVTIFADYHSEPVRNGGCYAAATALVLETEACVPACGDRVCGPDGCGGTCGAGCTGSDKCLLDGSACAADPGCFHLTLRGGALDNLTAGVYRLDVTNQALGALAEADFLQLEFYSKATGSFDLSKAPNDDYATCRQCVRMVLDGKRELFQAGGTIVVSQSSDPLGDPDASPPGGALSATFAGLRLVEVRFDEETFHATPIPGGACIDLTVDAPVERTPQ